MVEIKSTSNPKYKYIKSLSAKKARYKNGEYTVEGIKSVSDAIAAGSDIRFIAVSDWFYNNESFDYPDNAEILKISDSIFDALCDTTTPQGILAVIKMRDTSGFLPDIAKSYVYCDGVNDPGNLGTIIRTADAAGFGGDILSDGCADLYSPKTVRASMGSFFNIEIIPAKSAEDLEKYMGMGFKIIGGALSDDSVDYRDADMSNPVIIAVGNEANGLSGAVLRLCRKVKIPIFGKAESLNVSVAAGILMYESARKSI